MTEQMSGDLSSLMKADPFIGKVLCRRHPSSYEMFCSQIEEDLDGISLRLTESRQNMQEHSEDAVSDDIFRSLLSSGYNAEREPPVGGHVDIVIRHNNWIWLGEAKFDTSYENLVEGVLQLTTRYADGRDGRNRCSLLIYIRSHKDATAFLNEWRTRVLQISGVTQVSSCTKNQLAFVTDAVADLSKFPLTMRHMPVLMYFEPKDKSARRSAAKKALKSANGGRK